MTCDQIREFVKANVRYKDGWEFVVHQKNSVPFLQVVFYAPSEPGGPNEKQSCRKWQLSEFMTPTEIVRTAFKAVQQAEQHETEELFMYKGVAIFNPHRDVESLLSIASQEDRRT